MIEDAKRSIAFLCPVCRQPVILERTVFQLAASGSRLPCPCGKSVLLHSGLPPGEDAGLFLRQFRTGLLLCGGRGVGLCRHAAAGGDGGCAGVRGGRPGNLSQRPGDGGNPGRTAGHWPTGRHLLYLRMQGVEAEDQLQFGGAVLRPVRRCAETPCGNHVGH